MAKFWNPNPALRTSGGAEAAAGKIASEAQEGA
jgi:hypothetical protein